MTRIPLTLLTLFLLISPTSAQNLKVGFGKADITPKLDKKPVYLAGFGQNRKATGVHDPLFARAVVLSEGKKTIALVSLDLVGFFYQDVLEVRSKLPGFHYVLISSTHNHEGPDTVGIWGPSPFKSGVDPDYLKHVKSQIVRAIKDADKNKKECTAEIGSENAPELLVDTRLPQVKHDTLMALRFKQGKKPLGILVQWNCHPETMSSKNTMLTADFVAPMITYLEKKHQCPVVQFTGTVGGLMTSLRVPVKNDQGKPLRDGTWEKTERYGQLVGEAADRALKKAVEVKLTPMRIRSKQCFIPLDNRLYLLGRQLGVLKREAFIWSGDPYQAKPIIKRIGVKRMCVRTEVAHLGLGELDIAAIPGEIYPELVLGKIQEPVDPGADYPKAKKEPAIYAQLKGKHQMLFGLANDEIGYIIPKRQWDAKAPFCYKRKKDQYGEKNSVGSEAAPILCEAFRSLFDHSKK